MRFLIFIIAFAKIADLSAAPVALHRENPHYFLWPARPEVVIT